MEYLIGAIILIIGFIIGRLSKSSNMIEDLKKGGVGLITSSKGSFGSPTKMRKSEEFLEELVDE
jgi:hypothetical protein